MSNLWVVSPNDLEGLEILHLLDSLHESVLISHQAWGASWSDLEPSIERCLSAVKGGTRILGVELQGPNKYSALNIDHHRYKGDDRSNSLSSIEQVAGILGVSLTRWQQMVAVNDRAYIPGLLDEFPEISRSEISDVRRRDRRAQGLTEEDEERVRHDLSDMIQKGRRFLVRIAGNPNAAHSDFLWTAGPASSDEIEKVEDILICSPAQWQYSGARVGQLAHRAWPEPNWSGGSPGSGYFCIKEPGNQSQSEILKLLDWTSS